MKCCQEPPEHEHGRAVQSRHLASADKALFLQAWLACGTVGKDSDLLQKFKTFPSSIFMILFDTQTSTEALPNPFPDTLGQDYQSVRVFRILIIFFYLRKDTVVQHWNKNGYCFLNKQCISPQYAFKICGYTLRENPTNTSLLCIPFSKCFRSVNRSKSQSFLTPLLLPHCSSLDSILPCCL